MGDKDFLLRITGLCVVACRALTQENWPSESLKGPVYRVLSELVSIKSTSCSIRLVRTSCVRAVCISRGSGGS